MTITPTPSTVSRLDGVEEGIAGKAPVRVATTGPITASGLQVIDGVQLAENNRVLRKDETDKTLNGIFDASSGIWRRALDANGNRDLVRGSAVRVTEGTANAKTSWEVVSGVSGEPIVFDVDDIEWAEVVGGVASVSTNQKTSTLLFIIDGGGSVISTGVKGDIVVDFAATIQAVVLSADQSGSIVVDVWKTTYAGAPPTVANTITAAAKPTLSSAQKSRDATLTGWTTAIAAGDVIRFNVDSVATLTKCTVALKVLKT